MQEANGGGCHTVRGSKLDGHTAMWRENPNRVGLSEQRVRGGIRSRTHPSISFKIRIQQRTACMYRNTDARQDSHETAMAVHREGMDSRGKETNEHAPGPRKDGEGRASGSISWLQGLLGWGAVSGRPACSLATRSQKAQFECSPQHCPRLGLLCVLTF